MEFTYSKGGNFEVYEAGAYPARLTKWEDVGISPNAQFENPKPQIRLYWLLLDETSQPTEAEVSSWVNQSFSERSKLTDVVRALIGGEIAVGYTLKMDDLVGKDCVLMLSVKPDGSRNKVDSYAPIRRGPPTARPRAAQATAPARQPVAAAPADVDGLPF